MKKDKNIAKIHKSNGVYHLPTLAHSVSAYEIALCSQENARALIPFQVAWESCLLPLSIIQLGEGREFFTVAVTEDHSYESLQEIRFLSDRELHIVIAPPEVIREALVIAYKGDAKYILGATEEIQAQSPTKAQEILLKKEDGIPYTLTAIIEYAFAKRASDIHFKPKKHHSEIHLRIGGKVTQSTLPHIQSRFHAQLVNRIKVLANCDIATKEVAQDGSFTTNICKQELTIRTSIVPTLYGEQVVLRLPTRDGLKEFEHLMLPQFTKEALTEAVKEPEGAVILCGPTGSGKTTTLYSLLVRAGGGGGEKHIVTLEDPVEQVLPFATQIEIDDAKGRTFAETLRATLRQDPDIMLVGEVRDRESAEIAIQATFTGHLLLTTLHARSVFEIFIRLKHFGLSALDITQSLKVAVSQRLMPRLCDACKVIDLKTSRAVGSTVYQANGCSLCGNSGYFGVVPVTETLIFDNAIRQALMSGTNPVEAFKKNNYQSFIESAQGQALLGYLASEDIDKLHKG